MQLLYHKHFQMVLVRPHKRHRSLPNYISDPFRSRREQSVFPKCIALTFPFHFSFVMHSTKCIFTSLLYVHFRCTFYKEKFYETPTHISAFYLYLKDSNIGQVSVGYGLVKPLQHTVSKYTPPPDPTSPSTPNPPHCKMTWLAGSMASDPGRSSPY